MSSKSWRDVLPVRPAAELFDPLPPDELQALSDDLKKNGLRVKLAVWKEQKNFKPQLIDGRSRLDALALAGTEIDVEQVGTDFDPQIKIWMKRKGHCAYQIPTDVLRGDQGDDPYAYALSVNVRRRHLSIEQKDRLIVKLLEADPTKSNRQVSKLTATSHPHVAKVRAQAEKAGDVETVSTSVDTKGRVQPARKPKPATTNKSTAPSHAAIHGRVSTTEDETIEDEVRRIVHEVKNDPAHNPSDPIAKCMQRVRYLVMVTLNSLPESRRRELQVAFAVEVAEIGESIRKQMAEARP